MKRRSFLERAAQWVAAGTAALVVKETPAAPVAPPPPVRPDREKLALLAKHVQRLKDPSGPVLKPGNVIGDPPALDPDNECWKKTYTAHETALGFRVSRKVVDEDLYGVYERMAQELGKAAASYQDTQLLSIFGG